ncbi:MAG TPA: hypothetical protein VFP34_16605 [Microlunatus sp.]|nr:hypothetical protein [Microlunatus sp.]
MQDVECRQPHTTKVSIISTDHAAAAQPSEAPVDPQPRAPVDPQGSIAEGRDALREALRAAASALKADGVPFALAGSYALWVHGAPEGDHDVDLAIAEGSVEAAAGSLAAAGFAIERPPEDWLLKAYRGAAMVDVIHRLVGEPIDADRIAEAPERDVVGLRIPVMAPTEVMITKLRSMTEQYCDFTALLPSARAVREQLDWPRLRRETSDNPYAEAFVFLLERLGVAPPADA